MLAKDCWVRFLKWLLSSRTTKVSFLLNRNHLHLYLDKNPFALLWDRNHLCNGICVMSGSKNSLLLPQWLQVLAITLLVLSFYLIITRFWVPIPKHVCSSDKPHDDFLILPLLFFPFNPVTFKSPYDNAPWVPRATIPITLKEGTNLWVLALLFSCLQWPNFGLWVIVCLSGHAVLPL